MNLIKAQVLAINGLRFRLGKGDHLIFRKRAQAEAAANRRPVSLKKVIFTVSAACLPLLFFVYTQWNVPASQWHSYFLSSRSIADRFKVTSFPSCFRSAFLFWKCSSLNWFKREGNAEYCTHLSSTRQGASTSSIHQYKRSHPLTPLLCFGPFSHQHLWFAEQTHHDCRD